MLNAAAPGLHEPVTPAVMARSSPEPVRPLNISPSEFCRQIGVKKTAGYGLIAKHAVRIIKLGPKSLIPVTELDRVQAELLATAVPTRGSEKAKAMAAASVASRRKRGNTP